MNGNTNNAEEATWTRSLGITIRTARKRRALTINQTAGLIGISPRALSSYEQGTRRPDARRLLEMAIHLQLDLNDLAKKALGWSTAGDSTRTTKTRHHDSRQLQLKDV
jgi:transcriptional regulator with XRE-family HTH domain